MTRNVYRLDGKWDFVYDESSQFTIETVQQQHWKAIHVPAPWQSQIEGLELATGTGWYRKRFTVTSPSKNHAFILHIGAAYHYAQVWLNSHYIGDHDGGWLPFEFRLDDFLSSSGKNELVVRVVVPDHHRERYPDFPASEILHGKQSWYGAWGGLWQSVTIEQRSVIHIEDLQLQMDADNGTITPTITLNQWQEGLSWQVSVLDADGNLLQTDHFSEIAQAVESQTITLSKQPAVWSPESPCLYTIDVKLFAGDRLLDDVSKRSGFRKIEIQNGKILLNGKTFYMRGALDQDYYPDTIATPPSEAFLRDQFQKAKDMGLNTIRYHIKIADPRYYDLADEMGLLLWVDLPNWTLLTDATKKRIKKTLVGMVQRDGHHPSICIWTIVNEDWGTDLVHNAEHRQWLKAMYHWLKALDPTRLVVDNSPCEPNFHIESDIADYHYYRAIPDHADSWDQLTHTIARDHSFTYSPNGDASYTGDEPIIVSEFGNWGLPDVDRLLDDNGNDPWWFETGHDWGEGIVYPHGIKQRFKQWHLDHVFGSFDALIEAMQWQQYQALKHEIETIRSHPELQGYVVTELTDVHWENNGLMDMKRQPRRFATAFARLNASYLVMAKLNRTAFQSGDEIQFSLTISNPGHEFQPVTGISWELANDSGYIATSNVTAGLHHVGQVSTHYNVTQIQTQMLRLYIHLETGERILSNEYNMAIYPALPALKTSVFTDNHELRAVFKEIGYPIVANQAEADIVVATHISDNLKAFIASGGRVLMVANDPDALPQYESGYVIYQDVPFARMMDRRTTIWNGDWVSSFSWLAPQFRQLDTCLIDDRFTNIIPDYVLTGFRPSDVPHHVGAGLFTGWVHRPVTLLGYREYHNGYIAITTFKLSALNTANPAQVYLVMDIINQLAEQKTLIQSP